MLKDTDLFISIVIPVYNEQASIQPLISKITNEIKKITSKYEIIIVNDGSSDNTVMQVKSLNDSKVKLISFRVNLGKAHGLNVGFGLAKGDLIFTMDGDLQDDPAEFKSFIKKMDQGYDVVSGWKYKRYDPVNKLFFSKFFNWLTALITGVKIHDFNCGFKLYRKQVVKEIDLYGELHRYVPVLANMEGFRVGEVKVTHHKRRFGKSKYGASRLVKGFLDLITVKFLLDFSRRPMHFFGLLGIMLLLLGLGLGLGLAYFNLVHGVSIVRPLMFLTVIIFIIGIQFFSIGLMGEMILFAGKKRGGIR
jgi:glycosyltransferase involved in cell wall biosynthesis